jgi:amino acid transporter
VVLAFWAGGWLWKGKGWLRTKDIDVDSNRRELPWDEIHAYRRELAAMPFMKRMYYTLFV